MMRPVADRALRDTGGATNGMTAARRPARNHALSGPLSSLLFFFPLCSFLRGSDVGNTVVNRSGPLCPALVPRTRAQGGGWYRHSSVARAGGKTRNTRDELVPLRGA